MAQVSQGLPLPQAPAMLQEKPQLLMAWNAINDWYHEAVSDSRTHKGGLVHFAGPIQLALKYMLLQSKAWRESLMNADDTIKKGLARIVTSVRGASEWILKQPGIEKVFAAFKSSLQVATASARDDFDWLFPKELVS